MNLTELVFAITLSIVVAVGALRSLHVFARAEADMLARERSLRELSKLEAVLSLELRHAQELAVFQGAKLQPGGVLTRTDGRPLAVRGYSAAPGSDAITLSETAPETIFRRIADSLYCRMKVGAHPQRPLASFRAFLGVGIAESSQGSAKLTPTRRARDRFCAPGSIYRGTWHQSEDAVFFAERTEPILLVPLVDVITLFLDSDATIRRYSHLSKASQAVCGPFDSFRMYVEPHSQTLVATVSTRSDRAAGRIERMLRLPYPNTQAHPLDVVS
ncbi:MAG: hypothetical protein U0136_11745 [Bdellovibrionota bacterium]